MSFFGLSGILGSSVCFALSSVLGTVCVPRSRSSLACLFLMLCGVIVSCGSVDKRTGLSRNVVVVWACCSPASVARTSTLTLYVVEPPFRVCSLCWLPYLRSFIGVKFIVLFFSGRGSFPSCDGYESYILLYITLI